MVIQDMLNFQYKFIIRDIDFHCYVLNKEIKEIRKFLDLFFFFFVLTGIHYKQHNIVAIHLNRLCEAVLMRSTM